MYKVSFIVPVYNVEKYLGECIESILLQDYKNKEIILVDDGSTDSSHLICDKYAKDNDCVKVIHKTNGGLSMARNTGLEYATGEYVLFVDSDDFIEPGSLKKIMNIVNKNDADVVFLEAQKVFYDGTKQPLNDGIDENCVNSKSKNEVLKYLSQCNKYPAAAWSKLVKTKLFDQKRELLFEKNLLSEDLDWTFKLILSAQTFACSNIMYYNYRQGRTDSITNSLKFKNLSDLMYIMKKWIKFTQNCNENEKNFILSELAYEYPIVLYVYSFIDDRNKRRYLKELKSLLWLLEYRTGMKYKFIKFMVNVLGVNITGKLLKVYLNLRK